MWRAAGRVASWLHPARLPPASSAGRGFASVAIGELNGDQAPDLAVANHGSDNVSVLLNQWPQLGDLDCDGKVDFDDIDPFVLALGGQAGYLAQYPSCNWLNADCNGDGQVNFDDIDPFVVLIGGSPVFRPRFSVTYDYRNQMVEYLHLLTGQRNTYAYDTFGQRIAKVVDAGAVAGGPFETRYFYDDWQVCEEQDAAGQTQATYVYGRYIDEVLNMQRRGTGVPPVKDFYYHSDDLHNVMALTDAAGDVVERYEYGDYGQPLREALTQAPDQDEAYGSDLTPLPPPWNAVQILADDFRLSAATTITGLRWWGAYAFGGVPKTDDFTLRIYSAAPTLPGTLLWEQRIGDDVRRTPTGRTITSSVGNVAEYVYEVHFDTAFEAEANTWYWLSVVNNTLEQPTTWGWETSSEGNGFCAFSHDGDPWQSLGEDLAFALQTDRSAVDNPCLFTGRRHDPETGWYYYRTRYLDPLAGRFTTRDVNGIWGSLISMGSGCTYVGNNPFSHVDPSGCEESKPNESVEDIQDRIDQLDKQITALRDTLKDKLREATKEHEDVAKVADPFKFEVLAWLGGIGAVAVVYDILVECEEAFEVESDVQKLDENIEELVQERGGLRKQLAESKSGYNPPDEPEGLPPIPAERPEGVPSGEPEPYEDEPPGEWT